MSIGYAVSRAFQKKMERGWEKWPRMFWAIDLHDVIIPGTYTKNNIDKLLYPGALQVLRWLTRREDMCMILWTASHGEPLGEIIDWLQGQGIDFDYCGENPDCESNELCCFDHKFYFDVLLEDKAGFVGLTDWSEIRQTLESIGEWEKEISHALLPGEEWRKDG